MSLELKPGDHVAYLTTDPSAQESFQAQLKQAIQPNGIFLPGLLNETAVLANSAYDAVIARSTEAIPLTFLFEAFRILRGDGLLAILQPLANRTAQMSQELNANLTLSGFLNTTVSSEGDSIRIVCRKPNWEVGANQGIKLKKRAPKAVWNLDGDDELIDENALLEADDLNKPELTSDSGEPAAKKACKSCSCGAEDENEKEAPKKKLTLEMIEFPAVDSSCGSCNLGDAFRCSGCAYTGLPAFTPGQKIVLSDDFFIDAI